MPQCCLSVRLFPATEEKEEERNSYTHVHTHIPHAYTRCRSDLWWCIIKSNCCWDEWSVETLFLAARVFQCLTEGAAQHSHGPMQGVAGVVHGGCQLCQQPPLAYRLYRVQGTSQDRARPPHQFADFPSVPVSASTSPSDNCVEKSRCYDRVVEGP